MTRSEITTQIGTLIEGASDLGWDAPVDVPFKNVAAVETVSGKGKISLAFIDGGRYEITVAETR